MSCVVTCEDLHKIKPVKFQHGWGKGAEAPTLGSSHQLLRKGKLLFFGVVITGRLCIIQWMSHTHAHTGTLFGLSGLCLKSKKGGYEVGKGMTGRVRI